MTDGYVHGYSAAEEQRLNSQANILVQLIHAEATFAPRSLVLEPGCGVGAQTLSLAQRNPLATFVALDRSEQSLAIARSRAAARGCRNVEFQVGDVNDLPFEDGMFDGAFLCFVLEHLSNPAGALSQIRRVLKPGARLHAFEGDHGSVLAWPSNPAIDRLVAAVAQYQILEGGDPYIGRRLSPLLREAGFCDVAVEPRIAYADGTRPAWVDGFTRRTFIDMMRGQREAVIARRLLGAAGWEEGIAALERAAADDATFSYTFFRGTATC